MAKVFSNRWCPRRFLGNPLKKTVFPKEFFDGTLSLIENYKITKFLESEQKTCFHFQIRGKTWISMNAKVSSAEVIFRGRLHVYFIPNNYSFGYICSRTSQISNNIKRKFNLHCFLFFIRGLGSQIFSIKIVHKVVAKTRIVVVSR